MWLSSSNSLTPSLLEEAMADFKAERGYRPWVLVSHSVGERRAYRVDDLVVEAGHRSHGDSRRNDRGPVSRTRVEGV